MPRAAIGFGLRRQQLQQVADVVRQIVELQPEFLLGVGTEDLVELTHLAGGRVVLEELVAEQRLQLRRMKLAIAPASSAP